MAINECISKTQFKYMCERIDAICKKARANKLEELTIRKKHKVTDEEAKEIFLKECSSFRVKSDYYLRCALDFSSFENDEEYDEAKYKEFCEAMEAEATDFKDRSVLCGAGDVLEGLRDFEKKYLGSVQK